MVIRHVLRENTRSTMRFSLWNRKWFTFGSFSFCDKIAEMNLNRRLLCIGFLSIACLNLSAAEECPKENDFMCRSDKRCIDSALMCNKENDCADHSDEENCGKFFFCTCFAELHSASSFLTFFVNFHIEYADWKRKQFIGFSRWENIRLLYIRNCIRELNEFRQNIWNKIDLFVVFLKR